ncbi:hypothetical protein [Georgenia sp. SUBG003]
MAGQHVGLAPSGRRRPAPSRQPSPPDGHVVALLQERGGKVRPVLVLDPA